MRRKPGNKGVTSEGGGGGGKVDVSRGKGRSLNSTTLRSLTAVAALLFLLSLLTVYGSQDNFLPPLLGIVNISHRDCIAIELLVRATSSLPKILDSKQRSHFERAREEGGWQAVE